MFKTETDPTLNSLGKIIWEYSRSKIVIVGIGNVLKGDDGFGPILINRIKNKIRAVCLDAATVPENYIGLIAREKPDLVLLIDAVSSSDTRPGEIYLYNPESICCLNTISTHNSSLSLFVSILSQECSANRRYASHKIYLIGFNSKNLNFDTTLSEPAQEAASELEELFLEILSRR